jgi:hypothetical protein
MSHLYRLQRKCISGAQDQTEDRLLNHKDEETEGTWER